MRQPRSWRELLRELIYEPRDKHDLAERSGIPKRTLERWANDETKAPLDYLLHKLVSALPQYREQLVTLLRKEFPDFEAPLLPIDTAMRELPIEFYVRVLEAHAVVAEPLHFLTITMLVAQQIMTHLDPDAQGLHLTLMQCVPPRVAGLPVRSLQERLNYGSAPWQVGLHRTQMYLGAESLLGYVAGTCQAQVIQNVHDEHLFPVQAMEHEASIAAYPLQRAGKVAGSFGVSSTQINFFTPDKLQLLGYYAHLFILAFEQFYDRQYIRLEVLPPFEAQQRLLQMHAQRIVERQRSGMSVRDAERFVQQDMEEELLRKE